MNGFINVPFAPYITSPSWVNASDGLDGYINIQWENIPEAEAYVIYRVAGNCNGIAIPTPETIHFYEISTTDNTFFDDPNILPNEFYCYFIRSISDLGILSPIGSRDTGLAIFSMPPDVDFNPSAVSVTVEKGTTGTAVIYAENSGGGYVELEVDHQPAWLETNPTNVMLINDPEPLTLNFQTDSLNPGTYHGGLGFNTNPVLPRLPFLRDIYMVVTPSTGNALCFTVENQRPLNVVVGELSRPFYFDIFNCGSSVTSFNLDSNPSWLSFNTTSGILNPGMSREISCTIDATTLSPGLYNEQITIAGNTTYNVELIFEVFSTGSPEFCAHRPWFDKTAPVNASPFLVSFFLGNCGIGTLEYTISDDSFWFSPINSSGVIPGNGNANVFVEINPTGLAPGVYPCEYTVSSVDGSTSFSDTITLTITE